MLARCAIAEPLHNYAKPSFWHRVYDVESVVQASLETVKRYIEAQGTKENRARQPNGRCPLDPLLATPKPRMRKHDVQ
ncbi:MAG: hypothetical protein C7B47_08505 [Sulfobacillus thermosulfidooxidans]|uniref:Transposase IS200-like domain-containing protein n=1 Tax=Sulfobacillus thermosulfidooxidans TaxID=28034 RepID=A0A2T2WYS8_SULTH|nr:MAG: hypothetical protein C7B47_08505 [Sulfobacillus thermosulfidooxidans]